MRQNLESAFSGSKSMNKELSAFLERKGTMSSTKSDEDGMSDSKL